MTSSQDIAGWLSAGLPNAEIEVLGDDGAHFEARIISADFAGLNTVARHRLVYAALGERMGREIHALGLKTLAPDEVS